MSQNTNQLRRAPLSRRIAVRAAGALALLPLAMESREIATGDFAGLAASNADVLGTGSLLIFLSMLAVTPMATVTGARWVVPLRWWFGVVFFANALVDLVVASIVSGADFPGGFLSRTVGHTFLAVGVTAVLLSSVLAATASHRAQQRLGRYWRSVQRITYAVWVLILLHLALLFGFGNPGSSLFYGAVAASGPLVVARLPFAVRWLEHTRDKHGRRDVLLWAVGLALLLPFAFGYGELVNTLVNRGVNALSSHPHGD